MKIKQNIFLFSLGAACLVYGLGEAYVLLRFTATSLALGVVGLSALVVSVGSFLKHSRKKGPRAKDWSGIRIGVAVVVWAVLVVFINFWAAGHNIRWDMTEAKQHTLSEQTVALLQSVPGKIQITAFYVGIPPKYLEDLLESYERQGNGKITAEIVDPLVDLSYAARFDTAIDAQKNKLIVQSANERYDVDFTEEPLMQNKVNNALLQVSRPERIACFLAGHGEFSIAKEDPTGLSKFAAQLNANHITARSVILTDQAGIPDQCDVLVVAGAQEHLRPSEEKQVQDYLEKGGDALLLVEHVIVTTPDRPLTPDQMDKNPSLNNILKRWGLKVNTDIVVDLASHASGDVGSPATRNYMSHRAIVGDLDYTFFLRPRSISILSNRPKSVKLAPLILTESEQQSWAETNRMLQVKFNESVDRPGPVPIAYVAFEPKSEGKKSDTRLIVITDADFLTNNYIAYYHNAKLGLNAVNWLTEADYQVFVNEEDVKVARLDLTSRQKRAITVVLVVLPLLILLAGGIAWIRKSIV